MIGMEHSTENAWKICNGYDPTSSLYWIVVPGIAGYVSVWLAKISAEVKIKLQQDHCLNIPHVNDVYIGI